MLQKISMFLSFIVFLIYFESCDFAPGSYPYAQIYVSKNIDVSTIAQNAINFKNKNQEIGSIDSLGFVDGYHNNNKLWYYLYFNIKKEDLTFYCYLQNRGLHENIIGLVAVKSKKTQGDWKDINSDLDSQENEVYKTEFENLILKNICNDCRKETFFESLGF